MTLVFSVAAARWGTAALWDDGMFHVYFTLSLPIEVWSIIQFMPLWLDSLPSQVKLSLSGTAPPGQEH